jgi:hypothetical protein
MNNKELAVMAFAEKIIEAAEAGCLETTSRYAGMIKDVLCDLPIDGTNPEKED